MTKLRVDGAKIRQLRQARKWSVRDLATRTQQLSPPGITRSALGRVERGESKNVAAWRLEGIARALGIAVTDLLIGAPRVEERNAAELSLGDALRATTDLTEQDIEFVAEFVRFLEEGRKRRAQ